MVHFLSTAVQPLIPATHAYRVAIGTIIFVICINVINSVLLRNRIYQMNKQLGEINAALVTVNTNLTKEIRELRDRLHKWEQDC